MRALQNCLQHLLNINLKSAQLLNLLLLVLQQQLQIKKLVYRVAQNSFKNYNNFTIDRLQNGQNLLSSTKILNCKLLKTLARKKESILKNIGNFLGSVHFFCVYFLKATKRLKKSFKKSYKWNLYILQVVSCDALRALEVN